MSTYEDMVVRIVNLIGDLGIILTDLTGHDLHVPADPDRVPTLDEVERILTGMVERVEGVWDTSLTGGDDDEYEEETQ